jgi:hypothetical protein
VLNRVLRALRRDVVVGWAERLVHFRRVTVDLIRRRWPWLTLAAIVGNVTVFVVLLVSLRAVVARREGRSHTALAEPLEVTADRRGHLALVALLLHPPG